MHVTTHASKLEIIEQVLHLESDEALALLEQALITLTGTIPGEDDIPPMPPRSAEELAARLQESMRGAREGRVYSHEEVVAMAKKWREQA